MSLLYHNGVFAMKKYIFTTVYRNEKQSHTVMHAKSMKHAKWIAKTESLLAPCNVLYIGVTKYKKTTR